MPSPRACRSASTSATSQRPPPPDTLSLHTNTSPPDRDQETACAPLAALQLDGDGGLLRLPVRRTATAEVWRETCQVDGLSVARCDLDSAAFTLLDVFGVLLCQVLRVPPAWAGPAAAEQWLA